MAAVPAVAGEDGAGLHQHGAASAAFARALLQAGPSDRARRGELPRRPEDRDPGHGRTVSPARRHACGFINAEFDRYCLRTLVDDPRALLEYSPEQIIEQAGSQGVELLNWIAARGAVPDRVRELQNRYHVPISNTASAVMLLEQAA